MSTKQIGLEVLLVGFSVFTGYTLYHHGVAEFMSLTTANWASTQVLVDLVVALSMVMTWVYADARDRGISPLPYLLATLCLGSIGPLLYLIRREMDDRAMASATA